jgi:hypothetical protein
VSKDGNRLYEQTETDEIVGTATASLEVVLHGLSERFPAPRSLEERWKGAIVVSRMLPAGTHLLMEPLRLDALFALPFRITPAERPPPVLYVAPDVWDAIVAAGKVRRGRA